MTSQITSRMVGPESFQALPGGFGVREFATDRGSDRRVVLCFPHVGGYSTTLRPLAAELAADHRVVAIDPPGHGACPGPTLDSVDALANCYLGHLPKELLQGALLFGYSLGAYVAHALASRGAEIRGLVMCAAVPFHRRADTGPLAETERLHERLVKLGGIPPSLVAERDVFTMFEPVIRADLRAYEGYAPVLPPLSMPTLVIGGADDDMAREEHQVEWREYLTRCRTEVVEGGHFFLERSSRRVGALIRSFDGGLAAQEHR